MTTPSIEERLRRARGFAALIASTARQAQIASMDVPPPAFWLGLSELADDLEADIAALQQALDDEAKNMVSPAVFV